MAVGSCTPARMYGSIETACSKRAWPWSNRRASASVATTMTPTCAAPVVPAMWNLNRSR